MNICNIRLINTESQIFLYIFYFTKSVSPWFFPPWNYLVTADFLIPEWMMDIKFVRTDL